MSAVLSFLGTLGANVLKDIYNFFTTSIGKISFAIGLIYVICSFMPYKFSLDSEIVSAISSNTCKTFFYNLSFLIPIGFTTKCIIISFASHYFSSLWSLLVKIYNFILSYILKEKSYYEN